jgi:branched-chain amino acid transport system ATP-binding protein
VSGDGGGAAAGDRTGAPGHPPGSGKGAPAVLEVEGLSVSYGGVTGLEDVTLEVPQGGAVCLLGPNGAGKTTLLRAISGLLGFHGGRVTRGRIRYLGEETTRADPARLVRRGLAQVLEGRHVFPELSVEENLRAGGFACSERRRRAEIRADLLDLFPILGQRLGQPAGLLSGGEQQMLAIARALMSDPRLLLLDEPSLGLAPLVIRSIGDALRRIHANGVAILLVEQSSALALSVASHGYLIDSGAIRSSGATRELLADDRVRAAYLGVAAGDGRPSKSPVEVAER